MNYHASLAAVQTSMKFLIQSCQRDSLTAQRSRQEANNTKNSGRAIYSSALQERDNGGLGRLGLMKSSHSRPFHNSCISELGRGPHSATCRVNISFLVLRFSRIFDVKWINRTIYFGFRVIQGSRSSVRSQQTAVEIEGYHLQKHLHL